MRVPEEIVGLMHLAGGADWQWAAAIAAAESSFNPFAVPVSSAESRDPAHGLWQMKDSFVADMLRNMGSRAESLTAARGNPFVQAAAIRSFWSRYGSIELEEKLRIYHYGHDGAAALLGKAHTALAADVHADVTAIADPDGYVEKVKAAHAELFAPEPELEPKVAA